MSNIYISEGEILDRYSILDIKLKEIVDKRREFVINELKEYKRFDKIKEKYILFYKLLYFINKQIWDLQALVMKTDKIDEKYGLICWNIHKYNQSRFRLKNIINQISDSKIKEQKSYDIIENVVKINSDNLIEIYNIIYCILSFDSIKIVFDKNVSNSFIVKIKELFPTLCFVDNSDSYININLNNQENKALYNFFNNELIDVLYLK